MRVTTSFLLLGLLITSAEVSEGRVYHRLLIKQIPDTEHTHVCTIGFVEFVKQEADGDLHIRVGDGEGNYIVAEVLPTLKPIGKDAIRVPKKGDYIEVCGITRQDRKHKTEQYQTGWWELHPVERLR